MNLRLIIFLFYVLIFGGCVSKPVATNDCDPSARMPSSLMCQQVLADSVQLNLSANQVIAKIPDFFEKLKTEFGYDYAQFNDVITKPTSRERLIIAELLYNQYVAGSADAKVLLDVGFQPAEIQDPRNPAKMIKVLLPKQDLAHIYRTLYERILSTGESAENILLPAIIFQRPKAPGEGFEYYLVRPGIDPLPSSQEGWVLPTVSAQIDNLDFARNAATGKLPLELRMLHHDLGHFSNYIVHPKLMGLHRKYFAFFKEKRINTDAGNYLNEFLSFPNVERKNELRKWLQQTDLTRTPPSAEVRMQTLSEQFNSGVLFKRIEVLEKSFFQFFTMHGGGNLDGRSLPESTKLTDLALVALRQGKLPQKAANMNAHLTLESMWGLTHEILLLKDLWLNQLPQSDRSLFDHSLTDENRANIPKVLVECMYALERRMTIALNHNMSAESLFADLISPNFKATNSYRYYREISYDGGMEYKLFVTQEVLPPDRRK